jgi:hypothetical protein
MLAAARTCRADERKGGLKKYDALLCYTESMRVIPRTQELMKAAEALDLRTASIIWIQTLFVLSNLCR